MTVKTVAARIALTKGAVDAAVKGRTKGQRTILTDLSCPGLSLIVNEASAVYSYSYKRRGKDAAGMRHPTRHKRLGTVRDVSLTEARDEANRLRGLVRDGHDPAIEARRVVAKRVAVRSLRQLAAEFAVEYSKNSFNPKYKRAVINHLTLALDYSGVADELPEAIDRAVLKKIQRASSGVRSHPIRLMAALSIFYNYLVGENLATVNPVQQLGGGDRPDPLPDRLRRLRVSQAGAIYRAAPLVVPFAGSKADDGSLARLIRFMVLVPARRGEVSKMTWGQLDLDEEFVWEQPGKITKNGAPHTFPLPPTVVALLKEHKATATATGPDDPVFVGTMGGKAFTMWYDLQLRLIAASGVAGWSWHDWRRTVVTQLAEHGVAPSVADGLLNHRQSSTLKGVMAVYQRASWLKERRAALVLWEGLVLDAAATEIR